MGLPAAKQGDKIMATDLHLVTSEGSATMASLPFTGLIDGGVSADVNITGLPAATVNSTATNTPPHVPPPGTTFATPPTNRGTIIIGSATVFINGKPAARSGDRATTCDDPTDLPVGTVVASGTVMFG